MFGKSRHLLTIIVTLSFAVCILALTASPQKNGTKGGGNTTVTGCLQKGDEAGEFSITGEDGKTYGLRSTSVKLEEHLGHKVTVTGKLKPESSEKGEAKGEAKESKEGGKKEAGDIQVSNVKMVSGSCQ